MGLLTIDGVLSAKQFWPGGRSDADTVTVKLAMKDPFVFTDGKGKRHVTRAFDHAEITGAHGRKTVIRQTQSDPSRKVVIRLQGIDAPELHYQPQVDGAGGKGIVHPFRQSLGETAANALHSIISSLGSGDIPCQVVTAVDKPSDVCDVFARVVGDVVLKIGGARIDINHRLLREGWVLPGLYNSMSDAEIRAVLADYETAKKEKRGLFSKKIVTSALAPFDPKKVEEKGSASFKPFSDTGRVNFPKFFRRQAERYVRDALGEDAGATLRAFIATKPTDMALNTDRFLRLKGSKVGVKPRPEFKQLATFIAGNHYPTGPEIVFWENDSTLVKAGTSVPIKNW